MSDGGGYLSGEILIGVDSGAEIPVWPTTLCDQVPTIESEESRSGVRYWAPGDLYAPSIPNEGTRTLHLEAQGRERILKTNICPVRRPLLSVSWLNDKGWDVHFMSREGAWMEHRATGEITSFQRNGGRFEMAAKVMAKSMSINSGQAPRL